MAGSAVERAIPLGSIIDVIAGVVVLVILLTHADSIVKITSGVGGALTNGLNAAKGQ